MFELANLLQNKIGWLEGRAPLSEYVISSRIRLARNLSGNRFPHIASTRELRAVREKTQAVMRSVKELQRAAYVDLSGISDLDRQFLVERHLISVDLARNPNEREVVVGDQETASLMINEEDHLRLQVMLAGFSLPQALERAKSLDTALSSKLPFAYRDDFGYITSCPSNLGTGLRASCLVHLPALVATNHIAAVLQELNRHAILARGFYGEGSGVYGDLFQISNGTSLGKTREEFTAALESALKKVIQREEQLREKLFAGKQKNQLLDRVWRSYGVLTNARSLSFQETMQELSRVRLALTQGVDFNGLELSRLNDLILLTQPAHIQMRFQKELGPEERDEARASLVRKILGFK